MLLTIAAVLVILWFLGLIGHIAGGFIHLLLIIALVTLIVHFVSGGRNTAA